VPAHCLGDAFLLGRNDFAQVLRVHTGGDCRRIDKVAEHDRDLAALGGGSDPAAGSVVTGVVPPRSLMAASIFCFFSAKRWAYSDMPSFSSQSAICCIAPALVQAHSGLWTNGRGRRFGGLCICSAIIFVDFARSQQARFTHAIGRFRFRPSR
jgi:hypothetical protein